MIYHNDYESTEKLFEKEKLYVHRFIHNIKPNPKIFYYAFAEIYEKNIQISIPIIGITKNDILLEYEYYKNKYKTNKEVGIINKKYGIDYYVLGLNKYNGINDEIKNMELRLSFILEYN